MEPSGRIGSGRRTICAGCELTGKDALSSNGSHALCRNELVASSLRDGLPPVEIARISNAAARMMQVYQDAFLALQKIRSGGKQTLVVQHVQVTDGGQAVIAGNVKSGQERG